jgi:hypothetical protein
VRAAQEADAAIYAIRYGSRVDDGFANLHRLAVPTGGREFDAIGEEMRNQYGLGFTPAEPRGEGRFHKIEVRLRSPGLKAQARSGYYR